MARTRKSVLGENPFATGDGASAGQASSDEAKPLEKKAKVPEKAALRSDRPRASADAKKRVATKPTKEKPAKAATPKSTKEKPAKAAKPKPTKAKPAKAAAPKPTRAKPTKSTKPKPPEPPPPTEVSVQDQANAPTKKVEDQVAARPKTVVIEGKASDDSNDVSAAARQAAKRRIAAQIRDLENHALEQSEASGGAAPLGLELPGGEDGGMFDAARELLSSDYYLRQWGRLGMRNRSAEVDDFGHDLKYDARFKPLLDLLYERYFRVDTDGIENVPSEGRALIVANHAGTFPYDGIMLKTALRREHPQARSVRWLAEDHLFYMPFVGSFLNRMGAVRACQENAERLLRQERLVAVFPEGAKGTGRLYRNRHKLQRFGRGGFVRLCLRTQTPVIPCVIVGAEESMPLLFRIEYLANLLGIPYIPITPTFPALGPLGVLPAPTKWQFTFGEPILFERYGEEAAEDHVLVRRLTERVRATMQGMLDQANASRRSVWFG